MHVSFPIGPEPDDSPNNQLVTPHTNKNTFDVAFLGALTDKWLGIGCVFVTNTQDNYYIYQWP